MTALLGLIFAFILVFTAIMLGGPIEGFYNPGGVLIVILGTLAVTSVSFSGKELQQAPKTIWGLLFHKVLNPKAIAHEMISIAEKARKNSLIKLEKQLVKNVSTDPLFLKGIQLLADGTHVDEVEKLMTQEASTLEAKSMQTVDILRRAGEVAPAMGLIGTLVGLIQMLGNLDDPSVIGQSMGVALLTTFYGAILAHMLFIPLAARIERISSEQALLNSIYCIGACSMGREENPRQLEILMNSILPPEQKVRYFK